MACVKPQRVASLRQDAATSRSKPGLATPPILRSRGTRKRLRRSHFRTMPACVSWRTFKNGLANQMASNCKSSEVFASGAPDRGVICKVDQPLSSGAPSMLTNGSPTSRAANGEPCRHCGNRFQPRRGQVDFCSHACRLWSQVSVGSPSDCWPWQGRLNAKGYAAIEVKGMPRLGHRLSWALSNNAVEIPAGLFVLHRCDNPRCVNPAHLYLGTKAQNNRDAIDRGRHANAAKRLCKRGHPLFGQNLSVTRQGKRTCKTCVNASQRVSQTRRRAAARASEIEAEIARLASLQGEAA